MVKHIQPTVKNGKRNEPSLGQLVAQAKSLGLDDVIQKVEKRDGTKTDQEMGEDLRILAKDFQPGEIATTNMSDGAEYTEDEIIKQIKLNNEEIESMKNPNIFKMIIMWIKSKLFDFDVALEIKKKEMKNQELIENGKRSVKDGKIKIDENATLQIGSILKDEHFTAFIIDKTAKAVILIGPNGHILDENKNYKNVQSKYEMFVKLFGSEKAMELMSEKWKLYDGNCYSKNAEQYKQRSEQIFDKVIYTNDQKNLEGVQSANGACGHICYDFIDGYIKNKLTGIDIVGNLELNARKKITENKIGAINLNSAIRRTKNIDLCILLTIILFSIH